MTNRTPQNVLQKTSKVSPEPAVQTQSASSDSILYEDLPHHHIRLLCPVTTHLGYTSWKLVTVALEDTQAGEYTYTALSYCWGKPAKWWSRVSVQVGAIRRWILVTKNLHHALKHLSHVDTKQARPKYLWVDALCINQIDIREKNHQVALMGRIYSGAGLVVCWVGSCSDGTNRRIKRFFRQVQLLANYSSSWSELTDRPSDTHEDVSQGLSALHDTQWFSRAWTFQEIALARDGPAILQCGFHTLSWKDLTWLCEKRRILWFDGPLFAKAWNVKEQVKLIAEARSSNPDLETLLVRTWARKAGDPRDKVFAVLGLYGDLPPLAPNYDLTVSQTFIEATIACIQQTSSLDVLAWAPYGTDALTRKGDYHLPSWVPDWATRSDDTVQDPRTRRLLYMRGLPPAQMRFSVRDTSLIAAGVALGQFCSVQAEVSKLVNSFDFRFLARLGPIVANNQLPGFGRAYVGSGEAILEHTKTCVASLDVCKASSMDLGSLYTSGTIQDRDWLVWLYGAQGLLALRPQSSPPGFILVSACYYFEDRPSSAYTVRESLESALLDFWQQKSRTEAEACFKIDLEEEGGELSFLCGSFTIF